MVTRLQRCNPRTNLADNAGTLMTKNGWKFSLGVKARKRLGIRMTNAGRHDLDQNLPRLWTADFDRLDGKRFIGLPRDR